MFEPFKFNGMQYLAVTQKGGQVKIVSFDGYYHGQWENIKQFKKCHAETRTFPVTLTVGQEER